MAKSALTVEEQELHINWSRGDAIAKVYASDMTMITRLDNLVKAEDSEWKLDKEQLDKKGDIVGKFYSAPVELISFRTKRASRNLSDEQKREIADRLRNSRTEH